MHSTTYTNPDSIISRLFVVGITYRDASVQERSLFNISSSIYEDILNSAKQNGIRSLFALSTCNRTELYGYCQHEDELISLLLEHTKGEFDAFEQSGFVKNGHHALQHLYYVASGLDSQITGDYEILGQLKRAVTFSKEHGMIGPIMDRTINFALQASKAARASTNLSTGTVSVSYAAIEWLRKIDGVNDKKILIFGTGKFGKTLAKNLQHYLPLCPVTMINRTDEVAHELAEELSFDWKPFSALENEMNGADIIIVCTNAASYTVHPHFFSGQHHQWIMDLSVPENVDPAIANINGISITDIDEVSQYMKATLENRKKEIPKAKLIMRDYENAFYEWLKLQQHVPLINDMKDKLYELGEIHFSEPVNTNVLNSRVNKTVGSLAMNLRYKTEKGCHYISAINDFLQPDASNG